MTYVITTYCESGHHLNTDLALHVDGIDDLMDRAKNVVSSYERMYDAKVALVSISELL